MYRYRKALLQRDVADYLGIYRSTYTHYEEEGRDYYPIEHMEKLTQSAFAQRLGVSLWSIKKWEYERVQITKSSWERYFK